MMKMATEEFKSGRKRLAVCLCLTLLFCVSWKLFGLVEMPTELTITKNFPSPEVTSSSSSSSSMFDWLESHHEWKGRRLPPRNAPPVSAAAGRIGPSARDARYQQRRAFVNQEQQTEQESEFIAGNGTISVENGDGDSNSSSISVENGDGDSNSSSISVENGDEDSNSSSISVENGDGDSNSSSISVENGDGDSNSRMIDGTSSMVEQLRASLLENYDKNVYPWEWAWEQDFEESANEYDRVGEKGNDGANKTTGVLRRGLPVEFGLNLHKVHAINVAESTADLIVWARIKWIDPRLKWDPAEFGGLDTSWFFISDGLAGGESSEIWAPDIYLWNQFEPMGDNFDNTYTVVSSDGSVFWSRPGRLKPTCKYSGLENFPYDNLGCTLEFGSWVHSGLYLRPVPFDGTGFTIGGSETAGGSYVEYTIARDEIKVENIIYPPYPCCPEEDWPVLMYHLVFQRSSEYYARGVVLMNVLLNLAAFGCFWIPPNVGERMGLAITCVLAAVASELVVAESLPRTAEWSWYSRFSLGTTLFAFLVTFESVLVIFLFYYTAEDLRPSYVKWIVRKLQKGKMKEEDWEGSEQDEDERAGEGSFMARKKAHSLSTIKENRCDDKEQDYYQAGPETTECRRSHFARSKESGNFSSEGVAKMADAGHFKSEEEAERNAEWQKLAGHIDEGARLLAPLSYFFFLCSIYQIYFSGG